ncbi:FprA family A-type flavoprotein [bacterium]|nr:FprA family A-type flavoprotein [bacterium]
MDQIVPIIDDIYWVGAVDHETHLFENYLPLPRGVVYNAYCIVDEKVALIDTVKSITSVKYLTKLKNLLGGKKIDYLIINHMEPDHSGSAKFVKELYPDIKIIGNKKTFEFLEHFYGITDGLYLVNDMDELDLGKHKLKFYMTPMLHWPETMMTYDQTTSLLFSGDAFGGFGTLDGSIFDDEVDTEYFEDEILRYFSNIVGKYSIMVQKALAKLGSLDVKIICSTHGPVWRKNPGHIINLYDKWSRHEAEEGVVMIYGSMYGNTERMMQAIARGLASEDITKVRIHNVSRIHTSYLIRDIWRYKALILGAPTYNMKLFPLMNNLVQALDNLMIKNRILGLFGTYGWSGGGVKTLTEFAKKGKWELVEPIIEARCSPNEEDVNNCILLGKNISKQLKASMANA